jgi:hypothetical protein
LTPGFDEILTTHWPDEIAPNQWSRCVIALDPFQGPDLPGDPPIYTNPPGTLITIVAEKVGTDDNGQFAQIEVTGDSSFPQPNAEIFISFNVVVLSSPSHH